MQKTLTVRARYIQLTNNNTNMLELLLPCANSNKRLLKMFPTTNGQELQDIRY